MTRDEAAQLLNGREYRSEMTSAEEAAFRDAGLVIAIGQSDDIGGFFGAVSDEIGAYGGGTASLCSVLGMLIIREEEENERDLIRAGWTPPKEVCSVRFDWCPDNFDGSWRVAANVPYSTFDILEDGERYCQGIVIQATDLK